MYEGASKGYLLAHALREAFTSLVSVRTQPKYLQKIMGSGLSLTGINTPQTRHEREVLERGELVVDHRLIRNPGHDLLGRKRISESIGPEDRDRPSIRL
jgi:hypothetical protein